MRANPSRRAVRTSTSSRAVALQGSEQLNWRLTDAIANFDERHGRAAEAKALYQRFMQ